MARCVFVGVPENRKKEFFQRFFDNSMFTIEGLCITDKKSNEDFAKFLVDGGYKGEEILVYTYSGKDMNEVYGLTGDNRYKDDLTFVTVPDFYNPVAKLLIQGRWFDDIVSNNTYREMGIDL